MALKAILDNLDSVDEALRGEYTEKDGKFYLQVEGIAAHPDVTALKSALDRVRTEKTELKTKYDALEAKSKEIPEEFTLDRWHELLALDDVDPNDPEAKKKRKEKEDERLGQMKRNFEQQITNLKAKYDTDIALKDTLIDSERTLRAKDQKELALDKAMDKTNVDPKFREAVKALHRDNIKHSVEDDGSIRIYVQTDLGEVEPASFLDSWANTDGGKPFIATPTGPMGKGGNDKTGTFANNPFAANSWNKTQQAHLRESDAAKAERMAKAAGFADLQAGISSTRALATQN